MFKSAKRAITLGVIATVSAVSMNSHALAAENMVTVCYKQVDAQNIQLLQDSVVNEFEAIGGISAIAIKNFRDFRGSLESCKDVLLANIERNYDFDRYLGHRKLVGNMLMVKDVHGRSWFITTEKSLDKANSPDAHAFYKIETFIRVGTDPQGRKCYASWFRSKSKRTRLSLPKR